MATGLGNSDILQNWRKWVKKPNEDGGKEMLALGLGHGGDRDERGWRESTSFLKAELGGQRGSVRWKEASSQ